MSDVFFLYKHKQKARGTEAVKARWAAEDVTVTLDAALGAPADLSQYQDCIESARHEGARMNPEQRERARELSKNPR